MQKDADERYKKRRDLEDSLTLKIEKEDPYEPDDDPRKTSVARIDMYHREALFVPHIPKDPERIVIHIDHKDFTIRDARKLAEWILEMTEGVITKDDDHMGI